MHITRRHAADRPSPLTISLRRARHVFALLQPYYCCAVVLNVPPLPSQHSSCPTATTLTRSPASLAGLGRRLLAPLSSSDGAIGALRSLRPNSVQSTTPGRSSNLNVAVSTPSQGLTLKYSRFYPVHPAQSEIPSPEPLPSFPSDPSDWADDVGQELFSGTSSESDFSNIKYGSMSNTMWSRSRLGAG